MFGKIPDIICYIGYNKYLRVFNLADHSVVMYVWPNYFTNLLCVGHIGNMANYMATFSVAVSCIVNLLSIMRGPSYRYGGNKEGLASCVLCTYMTCKCRGNTMRDTWS